MALGGGVGRPCKDTIIKRAKIEPNSHLLFMPFLRAQHFVDFFRKKCSCDRCQWLKVAILPAYFSVTARALVNTQKHKNGSEHRNI